MTAVATTIQLGDLRGDARRLRTERAVRAVLLGAALLSIVISGLIVLSLVREAWTFISQVEWASLWTTGWFPRRGLYDIKTLLVGSLLVTAIAIA
jgi:phosphate transport system permease protein